MINETEAMALGRGILPRAAEGAEAEKTAKTPPAAPGRLMSLDAYRGLTMLLMVSAGLYIGEAVRGFRTSGQWRIFQPGTWEVLAKQTNHAEWVGCTLWDLIQPSFMFIVGTALAFSAASRKAKGQSFGRMLSHAIFRAVVLTLLGAVLISDGARTHWSLVTVLSQIGLGYIFLFLLAWLRPRWQFAAAIAILVAYWGAFVAYKAPALPPPAVAKISASEPRLTGFAAHWQKHENLAAAADRWFMNKLPAPTVARSGEPAKPWFELNAGGYQTLNFVPSLATMIFGLLAGELISGRLKAGAKFGILLAAGAAGVAVGWGLGWAGICPVIKRIWSPSWAIYSAGWALVALALLYLIIDIGRVRFWTYPLLVVGTNSIAIYCMSMLLRPWVDASLRRHFGPNVYAIFGAGFEPIAKATLFLVFCWLVCFWMYRKKVFIRI